MTTELLTNVAIIDDTPAQPEASTLNGTGRVRITATRIRRLNDALRAAHKANLRSLYLANELLVGRETDDSAVTTKLDAIRENAIQTTAVAGEASKWSEALLTEFDAFL